VRKNTLPIPDLLDRLETFHGAQEPSWPVEPNEFIVWWHCGYPASDAACGKGWQKLNQEVGIGPDELLRVSQAKIIGALRPGAWLRNCERSG
jgi:hypothetical protein